MRLETRNYKGIDILKLPFKIAPLTMIIQLFLFFLSALIETGILAYATANFVDTAIGIFETEKSVNAIYMPLSVLIIIIGITNVMGSILELINARITYTLEREVTPAIVDIHAKLAYKYIEDANSLELINRVEDEMLETFNDGIRAYGAVIQCVVSIISIGGLILIQIGWAAIVIAFFCIPLISVSFWAGKRNYAAKVETRKYERRYSYYSDEVLTNREAVEERTLFGYTDNITNRYYKDFETSRDIQLKVYLKTLVTMKASNISLVLVTIIIAFVLIGPVTNGDVSPGLFMGIIAALFGVAETLGWQLQDAAKNITEGNEYMVDLTTFVNMDRDDAAIDLPDEQPLLFKSLVFKNVCFKYPNSDEYILYDASFTLESGKHYALVGTNGAGKTTITKLLTRLYDEYEGEILINGKELRSYPISTVKALFSIVYQDFSHYQISMADNIALGDSIRQADKKQLQDIINKLGLKDTINNLPKGMDTILGRMGDDSLDLSQGQWQKIAVARSLLSQAPVKILDEPTSALDPIAENQLYQEFEQLMRGKTTIFISHRLGSTKLADEILVIDRGRVAEKGTHYQLMNNKGIYAAMYESQREWYE
ncbi:ABC transporter ATP-binding protein [Dielma fastidiosa]|uniref:ATP-binding cassette subfamily B protein n=1 Tax=Dielma fastidiosa TaxID=1034346 RepID=A0A318L0Z2_9FIRM|nr:ABC transporter ATP-binding protein [Dielma fastidiosa]PXX81615.1 ATP-binding cassette subfamily B protein [Dielma fastidiosa]